MKFDKNTSNKSTVLLSPRCSSEGPGHSSDTEPLPADHPLRGLDNTVLTGHTGYVVSELYELVYGEAIEGINAWVAGTPVRVLNA